MAVVKAPRTLGLASFIACLSARFVWLTTEGITDDRAVVKASIAPWVTAILCAVQPAVVCNPALRPLAAAAEPFAPKPRHEASVDVVLAPENPAASSW